METENAGEGREIRKGKVHMMLGGRWVDIGNAEFLEERGQLVKVLSFTPRDFVNDPNPVPEL